MELIFGSGSDHGVQKSSCCGELQRATEAEQGGTEPGVQLRAAYSQLA